MNYDEARSAAIEGARVTAPHMMTGQYMEHSMSRGFLRCWPVNRVEDEPSRTQCDFRPTAEDEAADWSIVERAAINSWGKPIAPTGGLNAIIARTQAAQPTASPEQHDVPWGDMTLIEAAPIALPAVSIQHPIGVAPVRDAWGRASG